MKRFKNLESKMKGKVYQYKEAAKQLINKGYYRRTRSYNPNDGGNPLYWDVYVIDEDGEVETLCYNTSPRRAENLINAYISGEIKKININILENYKNNGYMTRQGLFADYSNKIDRIKKIAKSHADYAGMETGNSQQDHYNRVSMR